MPTPKDASPRDPEDAHNEEARQTHEDDYPTHEPINDPDESKQENKKKSGGGGGGIMALGIVCFILEFICFLFIVVATPLDIYKQRAKPPTGFPRPCYSMWGPKTCGNHKVHRKNVAHHGFPCSSVNKIMTCAAAFAIISIFFTLVTMIFCLLIACRCMSPVIAAIFGILCTIFLCITFACQCGVRNKTCSALIPRIRATYKYAAGFGLTVTAFCLQFVVTLLLFVCMCVGGGGSSSNNDNSPDNEEKKDKEEEKKEKEEKKERKKDVDAVDKK